jgi:hypothetical protein
LQPHPEFFQRLLATSGNNKIFRLTNKIFLLNYFVVWKTLLIFVMKFTGLGMTNIFNSKHIKTTNNEYNDC